MCGALDLPPEERQIRIDKEKESSNVYL